LNRRVLIAPNLKSLKLSLPQRIMLTDLGDLGLVFATQRFTMSELEGQSRKIPISLHSVNFKGSDGGKDLWRLSKEE
jgi:hypothetical protein